MGEKAKFYKEEVKNMTFLAASNLATAAADTSLGEAMQEGLMNMVVGLGTVFVVLIFLTFVISLFKFVNKMERSMAKEQPVKAPAAAPAPAKAPLPVAPAPAAPAGPGTMESAMVSVADEVEGPVAAAILAAVADTCGGRFKVTSIKKSK